MNSTPNQTANPGESRRTFIKKAATAAAVVSTANLFKTPVYGQSQAPAPGRVLGANDRINVAYIGTGKQGMMHITIEKKYAQDNNIAQVAVCDVYQRHLDMARNAIGVSESSAYKDHRKLLERKDIDAIVAAPTDPWHAQVSIDALEAGKHVFCEKPMTRYLAEAFEVYDAVKKTGKTYVIGSQGCMDAKWHKAAEWVKAGKLGPLVWGQGSYCRNNKNNSEWTFPIDPGMNEQNIDWERWLGKTPKIPFNPEHYFSWHKYYAYNSGIIGNLLPHRFQPLMLATGDPEFPRRVAATGTRKVSTDREITDTTHLLAEFPSGLTLAVVGTTVNEQGLPEVLRGRKATLHFASSQNRVELKPEAIFTDELEAEEFTDPQPTERIERLEKDFFDCIRSGKQPVANVELAIRAQTVLCLAEMSERLGLTLFFDPKTRAIKTGDGRVVPPLSYDSVVPPMG
ncbi:MAG TPA: Gfo/Idh/MocA family oxidoreductase [Verrucomicrobiota bacterium]|jgi:predicted dehydrogenase|nr:Gfo/Idh/MocA family oxidoreductase [Verrucomicrobiota bacterium]HCL91714.1 oxidoreductase [Limisphaerales bacterium]HRR64554.1 Gfo/Idh/MocA family oxidoreductase [Candidatus Paceibacterota bacterium]NLH85785.1 Gfo/Idh/MocA family oxidoreductase [Verrucomicrobiota bacterium]HNR70043.1 Gfo/Idh/MocA family oxidoreductase [Verrucomicrobiota bacterium]